MIKALLRIFITGIAVWCCVQWLPGFGWQGTTGNEFLNLAIISVIMGLLNLVVKPIIQVLSLPITCLTLGLFCIIINTIMLYLSSWLSHSLFGVGLSIPDFGTAIVAALIISLVSVVLQGLLRVNSSSTTS